MGYGLWVKMQKMRTLYSICFLSFWELAVKAPLVGLGAVGLKPGIYRNLKLTEPVVLKKGSYTFVGLEMHGASLMFGGKEPIVWVDATRADTVRFIDCLFTEIDNGTVLLLKGVAKVGNCVFEGKAWPGFLQQASVGNKKRVGVHFTTRNGSLTLVCNQFSKLHTATQLAGSKGKRVEHYIRQNTYADNETALRFESSYQANHKVTLKCNTFTTPSSPSPFTTRYGMYVEEGAEMPDIGGLGATVEQEKPAANWWPVDEDSPNYPVELNSGFDITGWFSPSGWETVHNLTENEWFYFRYKNEYVGPASNPNNDPYFQIEPVERLVRSRSDQINFTALEMDDACSNFEQILVFPTRPAVSLDSTFTDNIKAMEVEKNYLGQNIPNPASNSSIIFYKLPENAKKGRLEFFELGTGRIVRTIGIVMPGQGKIEFGLHGFSNGIYGYRLIAEDKPVGWKKMIVTR